MSDIRESFPTLEDGTGEGAALSKSLEGDAAATKVGSTAFAFKDSAGNLILPSLTSAGKIPVDTESAGGTLKRTSGHVAGSASEVMVAELTLTASTTYSEIMGRVSCYRDATFRFLQINDATTVELDFALCGSGDFTHEVGFKNLQITSGATGTQKIQIKALNLNSLSDFRAAFTCIELA